MSEGKSKPAQESKATDEVVKQDEIVAAAFQAETTDPNALAEIEAFDDSHTTQWQGAPVPSITWSASEFIAHHKTPSWYGALFGATTVLAALIYVFTRDWISATVTLFAGLMFGVYASRKPRQITYTLSSDGLEIDGKLHPFSEYRSFSAQEEGAFYSISLLPHQRFGLLTTVYYDPADEEKIFDILSTRVPHEQRRPDPVEQFMRRIRF